MARAAAEIMAGGPESMPYDATRGLDGAANSKREVKLQASIRPIMWGKFIALGLLVGTIGFFVTEPQGSTAVKATLVAQQLNKMMADPATDIEARVLAEKAKAWALDPNTQNNVEAQGKLIAEMMSEVMKDKEFLELANEIAQDLNATMHDPIVLREARRFTDKMAATVAQLNSPKPDSVARRLAFNAAPALVRSPTVAQTPLAVPQSTAVAKPQSLRTATATMAERKAYGFDYYKGNGFVEVREVNIPKPPVDLIGRLGELKVATFLSELGLLTALEKAGVFSKLEKAGAFSTAEKLLPILDKLGVLQFMQNTLDVDVTVLRTGGLWLTFLLPIYVELNAFGFAPTPEGPWVLADGVLFTGTTASGVLLFAWSLIVGKLQEDNFFD